MNPSTSRYRSRDSANRLIALSVSYERVPLLARGFGLEHLRELVILLARPLLRQGASLAYGGDWQERSDNFTYDLLRLVSAERRARHAARRLTYNGRVHGGVRLYVAEDPWNLSILEDRDPYPTLFRTTRPSHRRPVQLVVYDLDRNVLFSSAERPFGLDTSLLARVHARPQGIWAVVPATRGIFKACSVKGASVVRYTVSSLAAQIPMMTYRGCKGSPSDRWTP